MVRHLVICDIQSFQFNSMYSLQTKPSSLFEHARDETCCWDSYNLPLRNHIITMKRNWYRAKWTGSFRISNAMIINRGKIDTTAHFRWIPSCSIKYYLFSKFFFRWQNFGSTCDAAIKGAGWERTRRSRNEWQHWETWGSTWNPKRRSPMLIFTSRRRRGTSDNDSANPGKLVDSLSVRSTIVQIRNSIEIYMASR